MSTLRWPFLALTALAVAACGPGPSSDAGDASNDVTSDVTPDTGGGGDAADVVQDDGPPPPPAAFGPCSTNADCPTDWMCLTNMQGYPGGWCSRMCSTNAECDTGVPGVAGICPPVTTGTRMCQRQCLNGFDCGRGSTGGYTCAPISSASMNMMCIPACDDASCGTGAVCNHWTGRCGPSGGPPPMGNDTGGTCTRSGMGSECRSGNCILAQSATTLAYSGWNGGYCWSNCALPAGWNASTLWPTDDFPAGTCPTGSICFPNGGGLAQYDLGICLKECHGDSDCRQMDGYYCRRTFYRNRNVPHTWHNGYCTPMDCTVAGMTCPSGLVCEIQNRVSGGMTVRVGVCRPPPPPDGGADGGPDATADAAPDVTSDSPASDGAPSDGAVPTDGGLDAAAD